MKFISTRFHGYLDYTVAIVLIVAPWIFGFYRGDAESWVPIIAGAFILLYSLFTDYELGIARNINMRTHLTLDILTGIVLAASPWLFGFADYIYLPHLIVGLGEIGAGLMTRTTPSYQATTRRAI